MPTNFDNAVPIVNQPFLYINGFAITNDATTPNTKLNIAAGICRDSTNSFDINLGNYLGANPNALLNASTTLDATVKGLNGIDTGAFAASKVYFVYAIADVVTANPAGVIMSLALPSAGGPLMPTGYNVSRHIGYAVSDASTHFLLAYVSGNNNSRKFTYDAIQATAITAGASTTFAPVDLSALVPAVNNLLVTVQVNLNANAAGDSVALQGANSTGNQVNVFGAVTGANRTVSANELPSQLVSGVAKINYKVSSASDAVAISVCSFRFFL